VHEFPTVATCLGGKAGVHSNHLMTSTLSLVRENFEELTPSGITNGFGKMMVLDHVTDSQVFNCNMVIGLSILLSRFEVEIPPLSSNLEMGLCRTISGFPTPLASLFATANHALLASQGTLMLAIIPRISNSLPLGVGEEGLEPYIDPDVGMIARRGRMFIVWLSFTNDEGIPMSI
jgi:hypothetical protein